MSDRRSIADVARRLPFGIGTVVVVLCLALIACVGAVLAMGSPPPNTSSYASGELRGYQYAPRVAWSVSADNLPAYTSDTSPDVAGTWRDRWLISYPSGIGRAFTLIDRRTGKQLWSTPIVAGLGGCAFNATGQIGCAIKLGSAPDGFYLVDDSGTLDTPTALDDTAAVTGVGNDFLRVDQAGYRVTMRTPAGRQVWSRTFAASVAARFDDGNLIIATTDGSQFVVNPATGRDEVGCAPCSITSYPTGITLQHSTSDDEKVSTYASVDGRIQTPTVSESDNLSLLDGRSTLPVLTGAGPDMMQQTQGRFEIRDPAVRTALWQVSDPELSKVNTKPCGALVLLALKDGSHVAKRLTDGVTVGHLSAARYDQPDTNIDYLDCVGSSGNVTVFANTDQITAFDIAKNRIAWTRNIIGTATNVDGFVVLREGTSFTVLQPL